MPFFFGDTPSPGDVKPDWYKWFKDVFFQTQTPLFLAYRSANQTGLATATYHKVQFNQEQYDTHNFFDAATNYRFQPQIPGYYYLSANLRWAYTAAATNDLHISTLYLNNTTYLARNVQYSVNGQNAMAMPVNAMVYLNGSSDYVEVTVYQGTAANKDLTGSSYDCFFYGYRIGG
jgi:hypothetical protein